MSDQPVKECNTCKHARTIGGDHCRPTPLIVPIGLCIGHDHAYWEPVEDETDLKKVMMNL